MHYYCIIIKKDGRAAIMWDVKAQEKFHYLIVYTSETHARAHTGSRY